MERPILNPMLAIIEEPDAPEPAKPGGRVGRVGRFDHHHVHHPAAGVGQAPEPLDDGELSFFDPGPRSATAGR